MPSYRPCLPSGCVKPGMRRRPSATWGCEKRMTVLSGNTHWRVGAAIVTKDEDFPQRAQQSESSPVIIWLCVGNASNRALEQWFLPQLPQIIEWIEQGVRVLEIR